MDTTLTLKLDQAVLARAEQFAKTRHTSVSKMVERYLDQIAKQEEMEAEKLTPLVQSLYGIAYLPENADTKQGYYEHLLEKHSPKHAD
jgi:antitoxin component of RelBE/YafQ-DinJ toxin-antitoxin module